MSELTALASALLADDPYVRAQGISLISADPEEVVLEMTIDPFQTSFLKAAHGGCLFTLADTAFGLAANCAGVVSVGIDTHMAFMRGCDEGDRIRARAREISRSRRMAVYRVDLWRDSDIVATFTGTVYVTGRDLDEMRQAP